MIKLRNNSRNGSSRASGGVGVTGLLGIAFIVLKLIGVIDWSWIWVLCPFWIPALILIIALVVFIVLERR